MELIKQEWNSNIVVNDIEFTVHVIDDYNQDSLSMFINDNVNNATAYYSIVGKRITLNFSADNLTAEYMETVKEVINQVEMKLNESEV